jgi:hypothetical protein
VNLEALLRALPRALADEVAPMCAQALELQDAQRYTAMTIPARRQIARETAPAFTALKAAANGESAGWAEYLSACRQNTWLRARSIAAASRAADAREFISLMFAQRSALHTARDYTLAAVLEVDGGTAVVRRLPSVRKNASAAAAWLPLIDCLLRNKIRPSRAARLVGPLARVSAETVRKWISERKEKQVTGC